MIRHAPIFILVVVKEQGDSLRSLLNYFRSMRHLLLDVKKQVPRDLTPYNVVLTSHTITAGDDVDLLTFLQYLVDEVVAEFGLEPLELLLVHGLPAADSREGEEDRDREVCECLHGIALLALNEAVPEHAKAIATNRKVEPKRHGEAPEAP